MSWRRPACGYGGDYECTCGCASDAHCYAYNCPHSSSCRQAAGVDLFEIGELVSIRIDGTGERPAIVEALGRGNGDALWPGHKVVFLDAQDDRTRVHINQIRRMTALEALAWQA